MEEEFISYEQALALKELGYDDKTIGFYNPTYSKEEVLFGEFIEFVNRNNDLDLVSAPLKQQVFRWFREKHNWIGGIRQLSQSGNGMIIGEFRKDEDNNFMMFAETYDKCENNCINELIEIAKQQES
jgi:hypothetical protein